MSHAANQPATAGPQELRRCLRTFVTGVTVGTTLDIDGARMESRG